MINKKKIFRIFLSFVIILFFIQLYQQYHRHFEETKMVMGGKFYIHDDELGEDKIIQEDIDVEKYFRPSNLPVLNNKGYTMKFFNNYFGEDTSEIVLPDYLFRTPEDTIINYFSILREASNYQVGKSAGCGTIGYSKIPYPVAYNFLSSEYQENISYNQYLNTFKNILHINLLKLHKVPDYKDASNSNHYFVEIETIEGSEKDVAYFAYYYGYVDIQNEGTQNRISNLEFYGENYLCAPYHGWYYDAEAVVDVKYGGWCSLVKERYPTQQEDYMKKIYFKGTDGNDYLIEFYQLTNDTDIEIAQYIKSPTGKWTLIKLDPNKCLEKKK